MNKVLVDTNVLIYAKDESSKFNEAALQVLTGEDDLFLTSKNLTEYFSVVTKGDKPLLTPEEAWKDIEEFRSMATVLNPSSDSYIKLGELVNSYNPKGLKIHDYEIAAISLSNGINRIATFNIVDFEHIPDLIFVL
jgi:predicted nucleic acid-binding protein